ncbi:unnamed protein product [Cercopithifilaria johnstoni]|uniref:ShKT domain-containing protein n=1 Tax=Cercopithifilaria johnstoni TaxID=2874296 RepID=A0A8J2LV50_9BILA|nr:unnamed protein product [Cercopithifilaria johnstoni]
MKKHIPTTAAVIFLIFAVASAQQQNKQHGTVLSSSVDNSLPISDVRTNRQAIEHQRGNIFGLRNHRSTTAHYVNLSYPKNLSKPLIKASASNTLVKVYGEANPSKTDEDLLDIEGNTQIINVEDRPSSLLPSRESINHLSISGYGPPGQELEIAETKQQAENIMQMQAILRPEVENPYGVPDKEVITAETLSTSNKEKGSKLLSITNTEQAVILNKGAASTRRYEDFRETIGVTEDESNVSKMELTEGTIEACGQNCKASTESLMETDEGFVETVAESSEASTDSQEDNTVSSTGGSKESYGVSTEQFESTSISTEATEMSTVEGQKIESIPKEYGVVSETEGPEIALKTEVEETSRADTKVTPSESVTESSTNGGTTHMEAKPIDEQIGAKDFEYEVTSKTIKEQLTAEKSPSITTENLPVAYKVESTVISELEEKTYSTAISSVTGEETKYAGQEKTYKNDGKPDSNTEGISSSQQMITETKVSGDNDQNQENITKTKSEMNTDQSSILTTRLSGTMEVTLPVTSSTPANTSYITKNTEISNTVISPVIKEGYETYSELEDNATSSKVGLPALNKESASQLSKLIEETTTLSSTSTETKMTSEKATIALENTVAKSEDLKSFTPDGGISEATRLSKETSLVSTEQLPEYGAVTQDYIAKPTHRKGEAIELQKPYEGVETPAVAPHNTGTSYAEEKVAKVVLGDTSAKSSGVLTTSGSDEYKVIKLAEASERPLESKKDETASEETTVISKCDESLGLACSEAGPSEQLSNTEKPKVIDAETLEETTQPNELQKTMVSEQIINYDGEIAASKSSMKETKIDSATTSFIEQTASNETTVLKEVIRPEEQSSGNTELSVTTDDYKEASSNQATTHSEQVREYGLITSNQNVTASEANITSGKVVNVEESISTTLQSKYADIRTNSVDFGYGEKRITEKEYPSNDKIDAVPNSLSNTSVEEATENPCSVSKSTGEASVTKSIERITSGRVTTINGNNGSPPGYDPIGNLFNSSSYHPATDETTIEPSRSNKKLTGKCEIVESITVSMPKTSEITSVDEGTTSLASLTSESPESEVTNYAVSERGKSTETPINKTVSVQAESNKILTDTNDFGYSGKLHEVTEAQLIGQSQDSKTFATVTESTLTTRGMEFINGIKTESVQQPSAREKSPRIEAGTTTESGETSQQYHVEIGDNVIFSSPNNKTKESTGVPEINRPAAHSKTYSQQTTESTLMHIITNEIETPIPYSINEEALKVVALTKVTKNGPSKLVGDIIASTKQAKEKEVTENTETTKEFEAKSSGSEETSEIRNEMESMSSESSLASLESFEVTTAKGNTESEFYAENTANNPAKIPMGPQNLGYGNGNELSAFISSSIGSVTTTIAELLANLTETSTASELSASSEYANSETFTESESKSSEEFSVTVPSASSNALTESFNVIQKMLTTYNEITKADDKKNISSNIPISAKHFGYEDDTEEEISSSAISSSEGRPYAIDCDKETDEKGDLCKGWAKANFCDTHPPTMFLFCRLTCLCIGPSTDSTK